MLLYPELPTPTSSYSQLHYIHRSRDCSYTTPLVWITGVSPVTTTSSSFKHHLLFKIINEKVIKPFPNRFRTFIVAVTNVIVTIRKGEIFHPCVSEDLTSLRHSMWLSISLSFIGVMSISGSQWQQPLKCLGCSGLRPYQSLVSGDILSLITMIWHQVFIGLVEPC